MKMNKTYSQLLDDPTFNLEDFVRMIGQKFKIPTDTIEDYISYKDGDNLLNINIDPDASIQEVISSFKSDLEWWDEQHGMYLNELRNIIKEQLQTILESNMVKINDINFELHNIDGKLPLPSTTDFDSKTMVGNQDQLDKWKQDFASKFGDEGFIQIDPESAWFNQFKMKNNSKYDKFISTGTSSKRKWVDQYGAH